jgi:hypothetical protein
MQPVGVGSTRACAVALPSCGSARAKASGGKTHARWPAVWGRQPRRAAGGRTQHSCSTPSRSWRRCREHAGAACMCSTQTMAQQRRSGHVPAAASGLCRVSLAQRRHGCAGTGLWRREMRVGRRLGRQPSMEARARTTRLDLTTLRLRRELSSSHKRSFLPCKQLRGVAGPRDAGPEGGRRGRHPAVGRNAGMAALLAGAALMLRRAGAAVWRWESGTGAAAGGMRGRFLLPTARACLGGWYNQLELARRFAVLLPPPVGVRTGGQTPRCRRHPVGGLGVSVCLLWRAESAPPLAVVRREIKLRCCWRLSRATAVMPAAAAARRAPRASPRRRHGTHSARLWGNLLLRLRGERCISQHVSLVRCPLGRARSDAAEVGVEKHAHGPCTAAGGAASGASVQPCTSCFSSRAGATQRTSQ